MLDVRRSGRRPAPRWRLALGLALAATALARPQWGRVEQPVFEQAREILIAIDLSRSMMADDIKPSRLERARLLTQSLLDQLTGERIGLLVFSGTAFLQSPLSSDYEILREFLPELGPDYLPQGGTNYSALLHTALDSFSTGEADRFLVILSDGEADPADPWRPLADTCKDRGIHIIGLGGRYRNRCHDPRWTRRLRQRRTRSRCPLPPRTRDPPRTRRQNRRGLHRRQPVGRSQRPHKDHHRTRPQR
ncbi:VWA domain-containing protein [Opitutaceae bacterium TAV3]|nr:VWA domain-containing protein [Opitutaceae bacterium TAV3]